MTCSEVISGVVDDRVGDVVEKLVRLRQDDVAVELEVDVSIDGDVGARHVDVGRRDPVGVVDDQPWLLAASQGEGESESGENESVSHGRTSTMVVRT